MKRIFMSKIVICGATLFILCTFFLMGALSPLNQEVPARLKIYKKGFSGPGFGIKINDQWVIKRLKNRSWVEITLPPGSITLETIPEVQYPTNSDKSYTMEVEAGKLYYLEAVIDYEFWVTSMLLVVREEERAEKEMKRFKQKEYVLKKLE